MMLQHILVLILVIVTPLWDYYTIPRLKASTNPRKKIRFYAQIVTASWICAIVAVGTVGFRQLSIMRPGAGEIEWLAPGSHGVMFLKGIVIGALIAIFVPAFLAIWLPKIRGAAAKAARKLSFLFPSTAEERRWWWLVCITAGICEEIVYRGFLLHYLHVTPVHLSLTWALIVSSVIFGVGHLYQGIAPAASTVIAGFMLGAIFIITGSLLVPIMIHAVMDLRALLMVPEGFESATA